MSHLEFRWLSKGVPSQKRGKKIRYTSFCLGSLKVNIGDFVLVRNDDALDPEDVLSCFVARVKDLIDDGDKTDPYHAQVQWFLRISELPNYAQKYIKTEVCEWEVVQDKSNLWSIGCSDVNAETIFQRCEVLFLPVDADWESSLAQYDDHPFPAFFCRYAFTEKTVVPVIQQNKESLRQRSKSLTTWTPEKEKLVTYVPLTEKKGRESTSRKSRSNKKPKDMYCAETISDGHSPKVVIKRIDSKVLENVNGNARIFVADSTVMTIDDIAESFRKKLDIQKVCDKTTNSPLIHDLTRLRSSPRKQNKNINDVPVDDIFILCKNRRNAKLKICDDQKSENHSIVKKDPVLKFRSPSRKSALPNDPPKCPSPKKKPKVVKNLETVHFTVTRSGRKVKPINYFEETGSEAISSALISPSKRKLPRYICDTDSDDSDSYHLSGDESGSDVASLSDAPSLDIVSTPRSKNRKRTALKQTPKKCSRKVDLSIPDRKTPLKAPQNVLEETRQRLHVSAVPASLPCREEEYSDIYSFVKGCLCAQTGGCMYISGVPGTGKTATVHEVVRNLEEEKESGDVPLFKFVEVNGMWMTDPYQCYVHIFKALNGKTIASQQAANLLEKKFTERGPKKEAVILLVDELDRLWTRKQTVMYNIFDWPTKENSKLVVLAIANTMDLPERMMMNRISSRIGLTRKTFQPYTFKQLQEIIMSRIQELKVFDPDAVQLVARKVAAVSGDARRALDICRFATEVVKQAQSPKKQKVLVGMEQVDIALQTMLSSPLISAIRSGSKISRLFFQCLLSEFTHSGLEETTLLKVYKQVVASCRFEGMRPPNTSEIFNICTNLATSHLILVDNFQNDLHLKIRLNVSSDDVSYALSLH